MNNKTEIFIQNNSIQDTVISWIFGTLVLCIGIINTFWGNDPQAGIGIMLLSFVYFLPADVIIKRATGISIPRMGIIKIVLGLLIVWGALGVGELFEKIELMRMEL